MDNLFLLYGSNKDLMEEEKNKIIEESGVDEFNLSLFDMEEVSYKDAIDDGYNVPFISDVRVVVIKNCFVLMVLRPSKERMLQGMRINLMNALNINVETKLDQRNQSMYARIIVQWMANAKTQQKTNGK